MRRFGSVALIALGVLTTPALGQNRMAGTVMHNGVSTAIVPLQPPLSAGGQATEPPASGFTGAIAPLQPPIGNTPQSATVAPSPLPTVQVHAQTTDAVRVPAPARSRPYMLRDLTPGMTMSGAERLVQAALPDAVKLVSGGKPNAGAPVFPHFFQGVHIYVYPAKREIFALVHDNSDKLLAVGWLKSGLTSELRSELMEIERRYGPALPKQTGAPVWQEWSDADISPPCAPTWHAGVDLAAAIPAGNAFGASVRKHLWWPSVDAVEAQIDEIQICAPLLAVNLAENGDVSDLVIWSLDLASHHQILRR